ncbi:MAG: glycosyltransferase family 4 protein, partial [Chloroflexi bacterium]|nr:glycosyltransferase family 4 protein [Chloroflexota bacterium]
SQAERSALRDAVIFVGTQSPDRTRLHLRAADAFALYSKYEGLPHVVLEAMAAGTPVVVSDAGGNLEVVEHERTGLIAPLADEPALAHGMVRLLTERAFAADLTARATQSLERFSWERLVDDTEAALVESLSDTRHSL